MYKSQITKWSLDKKNKESEMRVIACDHAQRIGKGKVSVFRVRGKQIQWMEVVRYWRRKGVSLEKISNQRAATNTLESVECLTPPPGSPMMPPESLATPERIFLMLRDYHKGSFQAGIWYEDSGRSDCYTTKVPFDPLPALNRLTGYCTFAVGLFAQGRSQDAGRALIHATAGIKNVVLAEHPRTLSKVLAYFMYFSRHDRPEIALAVLRQIAAMCGILLGEMHPLKLICAWLLSLNQTDHKHSLDVIARCNRLVYEVLRDNLGPFNGTVIYAQLVYHRMLSTSSPGSQEAKYRTMLHDFEVNLAPDDPRTHRVRLQLANDYLDNCKYSEARTIAESIFALTRERRYRIIALYALARSLYGLGHGEAAQHVLREAFELGTQEWGHKYDAQVHHGWRIVIA